MGRGLMSAGAPSFAGALVLVGEARGEMGVCLTGLADLLEAEQQLPEPHDPLLFAYGLAFFIEHKFGAPSAYVPPDMDPEAGPRVPLQSVKLHAELAGIGVRSLAGDILLHPQFGFMYYASVFTELKLEPDAPMEENPCPAPSCVNLYRQIGRTPCMKFCPAQCLSGALDAEGRQKMMRYDMAACAEFTQEYEAVPKILAEAVADEVRSAGGERLLDPDRKMLWYKISAGSGAWFAQCFECMRVCPIATRAPQADPILRRKT